MKNKVMFNNILHYIKETVKAFKSYNVSLLPAHIAFYIMWSIVPIVLLWNIVMDALNLAEIDEIFSGSVIIPFVNSDVSVVDISFSNIVFIVLVMYLSSKAFSSIINVSNYVYDFRSETNFIKVRFKSIVISIFTIFSLMIMLGLSLLGKELVGFIEYITGDGTGVSLVKHLRWPAMFVLIFAVVFVIYFFSPSKFINWKRVLPGTIFTSIGWVISSFGYSIYYINYADYSKVFNSFANIIGLMVWIFILSFVLVIGLLINATYYKEKKKSEL